VVAILRKLKWDALFGAVVGGDEVTRVKPDPETIHLALKRLRARPEDSLVVGDTVNDVLAARGVPMKAVAVASPFGSETALAALKPDYFLKSLTELSSLPELAGAVGAD
jgi:phosphoglycolate phosphatase-like HAD superfamily hydrolase